MYHLADFADSNTKLIEWLHASTARHSVNQTRGKWNISQFPTGIIDIKNFYVNQFSRSDLWKCLLWPTAGAGEMRCTFPTITPKNTLQIASLVNVSFDFLS